MADNAKEKVSDRKIREENAAKKQASYEKKLQILLATTKKSDKEK